MNNAFAIDKSVKNTLIVQLVLPIALLVLGIYFGLIQTLFRAGIIQADSFLGFGYYQGLTLHGVVNAIVLTTFFAVAFGNALVQYHLKKKLIGWVNIVSFVLMVVGTLMAAYAMLSGQASVLYTFYAPLKAHPLFYLGLALAVVGSWVAFWGWIPLYLQWRREHPGEKVPLAVYGLFVTFIMWNVCSLSVATEILVFLLPWSLGWTATVPVELTRTLFWLFGHALVYFWLLPTYIFYYTILPKVAGGKLYSDRAGRLVFTIFLILSIPIGVHHQFSEPAIGRGIKLIQAVMTMGVAIPSFLTAFTIAASLEYAARKRGGKGLFGWMTKLPYFDKENYLFGYGIAGLLIFLLGGITGIVNASYNVNAAVHNTAWVPGHFHLTVGGPVFLAILGVSLYMVSKIMGKKVQLKGWNVLVPYLWLGGLFVFSLGLRSGGLLNGEPRRTNLGLSYLNADGGMFEPFWLFSVLTAVMGAVVMTVSMLMYFAVFFKTVFAKKEEESDIVEFPTAEAYHDEPVGPFSRLAPYTVLMIIIIAFSYYTPIKNSIENTSDEGSPTFSPASPTPLSTSPAGEEEDAATAGDTERVDDEALTRSDER